MPKRTIYRQNASGSLLWKIHPTGAVIEITLESYRFGIIGVNHIEAGSIWNAPGPRAKPLPKAEFERYFREALHRIKSV